MSVIKQKPAVVVPFGPVDAETPNPGALIWRQYHRLRREADIFERMMQDATGDEYDILSEVLDIVGDGVIRRKVGQ